MGSLTETDLHQMKMNTYTCSFTILSLYFTITLPFFNI